MGLSVEQALGGDEENSRGSFRPTSAVFGLRAAACHLRRHWSWAEVVVDGAQDVMTTSEECVWASIETSM